MDYPHRPCKALLPARGAADDEPLVQARHLISDHYLEHFKQFLMTKFFFSSPQDYPPLPISNVPRLQGVSTPPLGDTTPPRRRFKGPRDDLTRARVPTPLQSDNGISRIDEQNERAEGNGEEDKTSSFKPTLPTFDIRHKRHNIRIDALKKALNPMLAENGSAMVLLCWGEKSNCTISPITVSSPEDEVTTWREINRGWYTRKGYWRKHIPGFNVTGVDIVEVCYSMLSF